MKKIEIKCSGSEYVSFKNLTYFQGNLKKLSKKNLEKLKVQIINNGFIAPIFIWKNGDVNNILDGHGRSKALESLALDGYEVPLIPVVYIEASDIADARKKLLAITSQYGEFDSEELAGWLSEMDEGIADTLRIVDKEMKFPKLDIDEEKSDENTSKKSLAVVIYCDSEEQQDLCVIDINKYGYKAYKMEIANKKGK